MWNVRGLNGRAHRSIVGEFLLQHLPTLVCLQETKISNFYTNHALETLGNMFDYVVLSAVNVSGGSCWVGIGTLGGRRPCHGQVLHFTKLERCWIPETLVDHGRLRTTVGPRQGSVP